MLTKLISTRTHGMLDYATAGALLALPRLMGWRGGVSTFMTGAAIGTAAYSLMTDYELSPMKKLPMKTHLQLDLFNGLGFLAAPFMLRGYGAAATATMVAIGLFEVAAAQMTEQEPSYRKRLPGFIESIGDAIATAAGGMRDRLPV